MNCRFIWGLTAAYLDLALMFRTPSGFRRQNIGFPSWSWSAWLEPGDLGGVPRSGISYPRELGSIYSEIEWFVVEDSRYVRIENTEIEKADNDDSDLLFIRISWRPRQLPPMATIPSNLTKLEVKQLLVLQTSCARLKVICDGNGPSGLEQVLAVSADGEGRQIARVLIPCPLHAHGIAASNCKYLEFLVIGTSAYGRLELMAVETDERGISKHLATVWHPVAVHEWVAYTPVWRTVFLM